MSPTRVISRWCSPPLLPGTTMPTRRSRGTSGCCWPPWSSTSAGASSRASAGWSADVLPPSHPELGSLGSRIVPWTTRVGGVVSDRSGTPCWCQRPAAGFGWGVGWGYSDRSPGCGAVWLARLTGGQEVGSSNLPSPTRHESPATAGDSPLFGPGADCPGGLVVGHVCNRYALDAVSVRTRGTRSDGPLMSSHRRRVVTEHPRRAERGRHRVRHRPPDPGRDRQ